MIGTIQEGRYRVVRKLGEGGQGEVYLVEHVFLERPEALKVLRAELAGDPQFVGRFRREARATNRVQHPNIVGVYDFGRLADGRYFLAMEYVEGERLDRVIQRAPLAPPRAVRIAAQLARAAAHAHGLGVIHRDLKPANLILVTHRGQADVVKVLDFGMAKILERPGRADAPMTTLDGFVTGTAPYMAPEQFLDRPGDGRIDVYAIGCLLYELLTGAPPFAGGPVRLMEQHLRAAPEPPSRRRPDAAMSAALDALVLRALAKAPDDRWPGAAALADALDRIRVGAAAAVDRGRPRLGVAVPRVLDDFGGDTANDRGADPEGTDPGDGQTQTTLPLALGQRLEAASTLLLEVADALLDRDAGDAAIVAGAAQLRDLGARAARIRVDATEVEARTEALEQSAREREASLSFAIGELIFDRDLAGDGGADVAEQIAALERSLAALSAESRRDLAALDELALGLASALHDAEEELAAAARRFADVLAPPLDRLDDGDGGGTAPLRSRLATARGLVSAS